MTSPFCLVGDRVYCAWQDSDQWYYATVIVISDVDGVSRFDVRYGDGTTECGITEVCTQFISRPDVLVDVEESGGVVGGGQVDKGAHGW